MSLNSIIHPVIPAVKPINNPAWTTYNPTWTATVNPTLSNTAVESASYLEIDKTLYIKYSLYTAGTLGASSGTGVYSLSIPSGFTIDTTLVSTLLSSPLETYGTPIGTGQSALSSSSISGAVRVLVSDATHMQFLINYNLAASPAKAHLMSDTWYSFMQPITLQFSASMPIV